MENLRLVHETCMSERQKAWQLANKSTVLNTGDIVKIPLISVDGTEHIWITVIEEKDDGSITGEFANDPLSSGYEYGDKYDFKRTDIEDLYKQ